VFLNIVKLFVETVMSVYKKDVMMKTSLMEMDAHQLAEFKTTLLAMESFTTRRAAFRIYN
jgi:hypothetical protein